MSKQIEAKFDKKAKDVLADTLGLGSLIKVPNNSRLTLNGNKLLQLLIAKKVDVDAVLTPYGSSGYSGILLGSVISLTSYLDKSVKTNLIHPYSSGDTEYKVEWTIDEYTSGLHTETTILGTVVTFKNMLSNLGELTIDVPDGTTLVPYLAVTTSSNIDLTPYNITTEEFLSFISITPNME